MRREYAKELNQFFGYTTLKKQAFDLGTQPRLAPVSSAKGYHIYVEVRVHNELGSPTDKRDTIRYLNLLQVFTSSSSRICDLWGATVLEVQGPRVHILLPCDEIGKIGFESLLGLSQDLFKAIDSTFRTKIGKHFEGVAMAADYGEAILLHSIVRDADSIVSLGNCANAPAKRLGTFTGGSQKLTVHHGELSVPRHIVSLGFRYQRSGSSNWVEFDLSSINRSVPSYKQRALSAVLEAFEEPERFNSDDFHLAGDYFNNLESRTSRSVLSFFGFCLRSDLSGFTVQVAGCTTLDQMTDLASRFYELMESYNDYVIKLRPTSVMPMSWTGDCATLLFLPPDDKHSYLESRSYLPIRKCHHWFDHMGKEAKRLLNSTWSLGFAGGDVGNNSSFNIIRATLSIGNRLFPIAVGKGVKRSSDGEQTKNLYADEMALYGEDYEELDSEYQEIFSPLNSLFYKTRKKDLARLMDRGSPTQIAAPAIFTSKTGTSSVLPQSRSHYSSDNSWLKLL